MVLIKERNEQKEYIRTFSIIAVVAIHTAYTAILQFGDTISTTIVYRCIMNLMWWAVPCFLMLSGSLLLNQNKEISLKKLFKKYIARMLIVLFIFGMIFSWMELFFDSHELFSIRQIEQAFINVISGNSWAHMWYIYCLIGLYLLLPLWKIVADNASDKILIYILVVLFICNSCMQLTKIFGVKLGFYNHIKTIYPFWFLMGAAWNRGLLNEIRKYSSVVVSVVSILLILITILTEVYNFPFKIFFGYDSILVVIQSIVIFSIIINIKIKSNIIRKIVLEIADKSFGIYIVHMFFVNVIYNSAGLNPFVLKISAVGVLFLLVIVNLFLSYIVTLIMKKLPFFKQII